jgi:hypothetical protein
MVERRTQRADKLRLYRERHYLTPKLIFSPQLNNNGLTADTILFYLLHYV